MTLEIIKNTILIWVKTCYKTEHFHVIVDSIDKLINARKQIFGVDACEDAEDEILTACVYRKAKLGMIDAGRLPSDDEQKDFDSAYEEIQPTDLGH